MIACSVRALIINVLVLNAGADLPTEEYAWRDYQGVAPFDAFKAGVDENGKVLYIGQVLHEDKLIPGQIKADADHISFEWSYGERTAKKNVKIFCSAQAHKLEWVPAKASELIPSDTSTFVNGGHELNFFTYLGRLQSHGVTKSVGKVICKPNQCLGLYTTDNGQSVINPQFEVLRVNEHLPSSPGSQTDRCHEPRRKYININFFN